MAMERIKNELESSSGLSPTRYFLLVSVVSVCRNPVAL